MPSIFGQTTFSTGDKTALGLPNVADSLVINHLNGYRSLFLELGISPFLDDEIETTEIVSTLDSCFDTSFPINSITDIKSVNCNVVGSSISTPFIAPCFDNYSKSICLKSQSQTCSGCNFVKSVCDCSDFCSNEPKKAGQIQITYKTGFTSSDNDLLFLGLKTLPYNPSQTASNLGAKKSHKSDDSETSWYQPTDSKVEAQKSTQLAILKSILAKYIPKPKSKISFV